MIKRHNYVAKVRSFFDMAKEFIDFSTDKAQIVPYFNNLLLILKEIYHIGIIRSHTTSVFPCFWQFFSFFSQKSLAFTKK